jgi:rubrerythrin
MEPSAQGPPTSLQCIDAIEVSLCIEKQGLAFYEKAVKGAVDVRVREMFSRLAEEEKEHIQSLQTKARFLRPAVVKNSISRKSQVHAFIAEELEGKVFPVQGAEPGTAGNDLEALEIGIEAEKRSIEVLEQLIKREKKIDVRAIFSHLVVEEKKHLAALEELKQSLS